MVSVVTSSARISALISNSSGTGVMVSVVCIDSAIKNSRINQDLANKLRNSLLPLIGKQVQGSVVVVGKSCVNNAF
jgi:hypothetical protein